MIKKIVLLTCFLCAVSIVLQLVSFCQESTWEAMAQANAPAEKATYVGAERCKMCHAQRYEDFKKKRFLKAWKVLEMRGETKNPECLKCHTTGYGKPGGFTSEEATPHLRYKQCEACHGPASLHVNNPSKKDYQEELMGYMAKEDVCIKCHVCVTTHGGTGEFD